jgi:hypothetical protein
MRDPAINPKYDYQVRHANALKQLNDAHRVMREAQLALDKARQELGEAGRKFQDLNGGGK